MSALKTWQTGHSSSPHAIGNPIPAAVISRHSSMAASYVCLLLSTLPLVVGAVVALPGQSAAAEQAVYLDPARAGPDFRVQGEYVGLVGNLHPIAAQVISIGDGQFDGVLYSGGLPGAGWDGVSRYAFRGKTEQGTTRFHGVHGEQLAFENPLFSAVHDNGTIEGTARMFLNRVADASFVLHKKQRSSPSLGAPAPPGATVLFDGSNTTAWQVGTIVEEKLLDRGATSKQAFGSHFLHLEFRCPFMPTARGMRRGNSGVYLQSTWELQILDSFGWNRDNRKFERLSALGRCGGLAEMTAPEINAAFPPLSWQTYDIEFRAARYGTAGQILHPAMITAYLNGIRIHNQVVLPAAPPEEQRPPPRHSPRGVGRLHLQDHGNPVHFRNIWIIERPRNQM